MKTVLKALSTVLLTLCVLALAAGPVLATTTTTLVSCANGGIACNTSPGTGSCGTTSAAGFTGMCAGTSSACSYVHCGAAAVCVAGLFSGSPGCSSDSACPSGYACISDSGSNGCGTGWSICMLKLVEP
jgi:hypothetical protein